MSGFLPLLRYFVVREFRDAHQLWSLLLFALTAVYACYRIAQGRVDPSAWVTLHWVVVLFSAFNAAARVHADDHAEVRTWMRAWVSPRTWAAARMVHATAVLWAVVLAVFAGFALFLPQPFLAHGSGAWLAGMAATGWALAALLTLVSDVAMRAGGGFGLTAVLGLPLVVPVVMVSTAFCHGVARGAPWGEVWVYLAFLAALAGLAHAMAALVFPYLWRD